MTWIGGGRRNPNICDEAKSEKVKEINDKNDKKQGEQE